jgi:pimeloyl-ACP methyl ester carboxylesterase
VQAWQRLLVLVVTAALAAWLGARMPHAEAPPRPREGGAYAPVRDVRMYYEVRGPAGGQPLLVLHGGGVRLERMDAQATFFSKEFRVIVPEQIGHGRTSDAPRAYRFDDMADDTVALLDRLGVKARVDCLGWSDGGIVCLDLAIRHPERVLRLAVSGASFRTDGLVAPAQAWVEHARGQDLMPDAPAVGDKVLAMWRTQPMWTQADLARIDAPVLVLAGEKDMVRADHTRALAAAIPRARVVIVPGASHSLPSEKPETFNAEVDAFFHEAR